LFSADLNGITQGIELQLTHEPGGVWDYHVAGDGSAIAYSSPRDQHGNDLFAVSRDGSNARRLLDCGSDDCFGPRWAPGGGRIAFARRTLPGPPRVHLLDPASGTVRPVLDDASFVGFEPRWAPNGDWLAWVAPLENGVRLVRLSDGASAFVPSRTGEPPVWNRTSSKLLVTDVDMDDPDFRTRLVILDVATLSLDATDSGFEEWGLRWAPDGQRVTVLRRTPGEPGGGQVWLVGQQGPARQLTDESSLDHGAAQWSVDGRYLAFHRVSLDTPGAPTEIVLWDTETGTAAGAAFTGRLPSWLP
jgi:Tol biopolymer transport system component